MTTSGEAGVWAGVAYLLQAHTNSETKGPTVRIYGWEGNSNDYTYRARHLVNRLTYGKYSIRRTA